jgi:hypothetical protein
MPTHNADDSLLDKAIARVRQLMGHAIHDPDTRLNASRETFSDPGEEIRLVQAANRIECSESVLKRIVAAKSVGDLLDCTAEIRYALVFDGLHFNVKFATSGTVAMPDLLVSRDGHSAYVEVRRIRQPDPLCMPAPLRPRDEDDPRLADLLRPYGGEENVRKIEQELRGKFRQVQALKGSNTVIATWSDRDFVEEVDFEEAVRNIRRSPTDADDQGPFRPICCSAFSAAFGWLLEPVNSFTANRYAS